MCKDRSPFLHALDHLERVIKLSCRKVPLSQKRVNITDSHSRFDVGRSEQSVAREGEGKGGGKLKTKK